MRNLEDYLAHCYASSDPMHRELHENISEQVRFYCVILNMISDLKTLQFYPLENEEDSINAVLQAAVWKFLGQYANAYMKSANSKNDVSEIIREQNEFLNRFSDVTYTKDRINRMLGQLGTDGFVEAMDAYANVHREICADLGMCAAFDFDSFGYLVYLSNLYIEHMENEELSYQELIDEQPVHYEFRNARYLEVIQTLFDSGNDKTDLIQKTAEMTDTLRARIKTHLLPDLRSHSNSSLDTESLSHLCEKTISKPDPVSCADLSEVQGEELALTYLDRIYADIENFILLFNSLGYELRKGIAFSQNQSDETNENGIRPKTEKQLANSITDYLRYARVIRHMCRFLSDCGFRQTAALKPPYSYHRELYKKVYDSNWAKTLREDEKSLCKQVGTFYNEAYRMFNYSYDFSDQVTFVLQNYYKAHDTYMDLYQLLDKNSQWLDQVDKVNRTLKDHTKTKNNESQIETIVDDWFTYFYEPEKKNVSEKDNEA